MKEHSDFSSRSNHGMAAHPRQLKLSPNRKVDNSSNQKSREMRNSVGKGTAKIEDATEAVFHVNIVHKPYAV